MADWPGRPVAGGKQKRKADEWPGRPLSEREAAEAADERETPAARPKGRNPGPIAAPVDGDTIKTDGGPNLRLWGVDAPERGQPGFNALMQGAPVGQQSTNALTDLLQRGTPMAGPIAMQSYGRPVAPVTVERGPFGLGSFDAGQQMVRSGNALAAPGYVDDPAYQFELTQAERLARQNGLGPMNDNAVERPADYRKEVKADPEYVPPREDVAQFWDTPTPREGLSAEVEQGYMAIAGTGTAADILAYAEANGFRLDPQATAEFVKARDGGAEVDYVATYAPEIPVLTDAGDGAAGAAVRGVGKGFLAGGFDELGAVADTLGGTPGRESVWNSDRRVADIFANNQRQNSSILGYDEMAHPFASYGGEIGGALVSGVVLPWGAGARTVPQLAKVGGAWGATEGFLGTDGELGQRLTGAAIGAPVGAVVGAAGGKAIEVLAPPVMRGVRKAFGKGAAESTSETAGEVAQGAAQREAGDPWAEFPDAPEGRSIGMEAEGMPAVTGEARQRDVIDVSAPSRPGRMDQPLTEAQRSALAQDMRPQDVLPMPANTVESVEEAAAIDAGRVVPAKAPNERGALSKRTVRNYMGQSVPKVGPVDLVGFLRLRGGINDAGDAVSKGGDLKAMGIANASRKGLDFVGQEHRFGPMLNERGMSLDEAALQAWEAGYFPDHLERPSINEFLDALGDTYNGGTGRRFLPEDMPELETYASRQAERFDIEQQEIAAGGPVYLDRSVPADDAAPFAPVEAYDDRLADTATRAGNIRLDKLESPQDIRRALAQTERTVGFDAATRGKITQAETEALAADLNMTADALLTRRKGQALNAEEALAARQILAKSGNELVNFAKRVRSLDEPGDELLAEFRKAWMRHVAIQEQVSGMTAEAGRALQQFRMAANSREVRGDVLSALVRGAGGKDNLQDAAGALLDAVEAGPGVFNAVAAKAAKPKWKDKVAELYINFLLSGPQTHVVNMVSNTLTAMAQIPEFAAASVIGGARRAVSRVPVERVTAGEVGARSFGLLQGAREGARLFARGLKTGEPSDFSSKVENQSFHAIGGLKGEAIRVPTRFLTAEDEFFKGVARRMELNAQAIRVASREGLKGDAYKARVAELTGDPTDEMLERALDYGRYLTFQRKLGPFAQKVSGLTRDSLIAKVFLPFVRTPTNLLKFAAERSPAAPLLKEWRTEFKAGGASRDLAMARAMLGTGFGMAIYQGALEGHITGSAPPDQKKARLLYADGWQPYSIKLGDQWYSYKRLDPFATTLGVAADMATLPEGLSDKQMDNKAVLLVASIMGNLASKTWLSGLSDLTEALSDPARYAGSLTQRLVASFLVPNTVTQTARYMDPVRREREGVAEELQSRIPGLSDNLLPQRDIWGREIKSQGGAGPDFLSPIWVSTQLNDPVNRALLPLDYAPGHPSKTVGGRELTPEEYDRYSEMAGKGAHADLSELVASPEWADLDAEGKVKAARKAVTAARKSARESLFGDDPKGGDSEGDTWPGKAVSERQRAPSEAWPGRSVQSRDVRADLERAIPGVQFTSGFRDPAYNQELKARGYQVADNSEHMDGSSLDMLPPPGRSLGWLRAQVKRYDPKARTLVHDGHLHAAFDDYFAAPVLGGARSAGVVNPMGR